MKSVIMELEQLYSAAKKDCLLKKKLLESRFADDPFDTFCKATCEAGHPITVSDLFAIGQENSDNQCKSTNGGNSEPYDAFEDTYELFMISLNNI